MSVPQGHCCVLIACSLSGINLGPLTTFSGGVSHSKITPMTATCAGGIGQENQVG